MKVIKHGDNSGVNRDLVKMIPQDGTEKNDTKFTAS